jgi:hypothetical protein
MAGMAPTIPPGAPERVARCLPSRDVTRTAFALAVASLVLAAAGCGLQSPPPPGGVELTVTRDFGSRQVLDAPDPQRDPGESVLQLLRRNAHVSSTSGGALHVNGVSATDVDVHDGDRIWFDRHDTRATSTIRAVVGSFPEPFLHGTNGRRLPSRVECAQAGSAPCRAVVAGLRKVGVVAGLAAPGVATGAETLRVLVGPWAKLRIEPAAGLLEHGPGNSGVYARPSADGRTIAALDPRGRVAQRLGKGAGLVAATAVEGEQPTWFVTGTDDAGVAAAARAFAAGESALSDKFALAVSDDRPIALPVVK